MRKESYDIIKELKERDRAEGRRVMFCILKVTCHRQEQHMPPYLHACRCSMMFGVRILLR